MVSGRQGAGDRVGRQGGLAPGCPGLVGSAGRFGASAPGTGGVGREVWRQGAGDRWGGGGEGKVSDSDFFSFLSWWLDY